MSTATLSQRAPTAGSLLESSLRLYLANFLPLTLIGMVAFVPPALTFVSRELRESNDPIGVIMLWPLRWIAPFVTFPVACTGVLHGVSKLMLGEPIRAGECLAIGFRRLGRTWGSAALLFLLTLLGSLALIVPGIVVYTLFFLAVPVAAVEPVGPVESLRRSEKLTQGMRGAVFGASLALALLLGACWLLAILLPVPLYITAAALVASLVVIGVLGLVATAVTYLTARAHKEAVGAEAIAAAFE